MTEELKSKANEALIRLIDGLESGSEFALAELPEVLEQLLAWKLALNVGWVLVAGTVVAVNVWFFKWAKAQLTAAQERERAAKGDNFSGYYYRCSFQEFLEFLSYAIPVVAVVTGVIAGFHALKIWIAPKVYLLEYAAELVK